MKKVLVKKIDLVDNWRACSENRLIEEGSSRYDEYDFYLVSLGNLKPLSWLKTEDANKRVAILPNGELRLDNGDIDVCGWTVIGDPNSDRKYLKLLCKIINKEREEKNGKANQKIRE